jgi:hypothetical protein
MQNETTITLLKAYDFSAARKIAEQIDKNAGLAKLAHALEKRQQLDTGGARELLEPYGLSNHIADTGKAGRLFEYIEALGLQLKQCEYSDFIRGITPAITHLFIGVIDEKTSYV